jgi:hypothetical protein
VGIKTFDVSDPENIRLVGVLAASTSTISLRVAGTRAYLRPQAGGLEVYEVIDSTNLVYLASHPTGNLLAGIELNENRILIPEWVHGISRFSSLTDVQFTVRLHGSAGAPITIETSPTSRMHSPGHRF